ncbi:MAG: ABC transporter ATP-binding protein, partial [Clostridia bacterium]|nr:ABC transporter ATP-binding protein [Clostridia bacterium]
RILLINQGRLAFDGDYERLIRMTGDRRVVKLTVDGTPPALPGTEFVGRENGKCVYRYDAEKLPVDRLFAALSQTVGVRDVEMEHEPIETVIARLYRSWEREEAAR